MKLPAFLSDGALSVGLVLGLYVATVSSEMVSLSPSEAPEIRFQWAVPEASASSGSGNVYLQLIAADTYSWVGLGIGQRMSGARIFIMYQDGSGNVTLSTRDGVGHVEPQYAQRSDVLLLEGSGVANGTMRANIRCGQCDSLDLSGSNGWISAWKRGSSLDSTSPEASITQHDSTYAFRVDFSSATVSADSNPFLGVEDGNAGSGTGSGSGDGAGPSGDSGAVESSRDNSDTIALTHGIIMTIVFAGLYPLGSTLMVLLGKWYLHAAWQALAYLLMWAGFGLGYWYSHRDGDFFDNFHTAAGTIVVALLGIQPVFGWVHHARFRKAGSRGVFSHIHIWYGRILIVFGIVNGGFGLQLAGDASGAWLIAYCVVSAVVVNLYLSSVAFGFFRRRREAKKQPKERSSETQETGSS